jgi:phage baseplate assembly protein W
MRIAPYASTGIDRNNGKILTGWDHVMQSLQVIFTTFFGERVMRRWFGSFVPKILGRPMTPTTVLRFWTAICVAIDLWEPRYRVTRIVPRGSPEEMRLGGIGFTVEGVYMPRGQFGDTTPEGGQYKFAVGDNGRVSTT